ncbi:MAG TPA: HPr(Ser) kinase/phosphatase [Verrucomicrobiae bacterium]|nr:HPr(Ser) kinase/phosphatase [Verrucomicrobiae bacterium]
MAAGRPGRRRGAAGTAGFFNPVHPFAVQVLGDAGAAWLAALAPGARAALPRVLRRQGMRSLIVAAGIEPGPLHGWAAAGIAVERREQPAHEIVESLRAAAAATARSVWAHGVMLVVHRIGVLIEGAAATGKSTLALELVSRGHVLVADDAVELRRPAPGIVVAHGPALLAGYLEARGLGVLDVRRMHGAGAHRTQRRLDLVVRLVPLPRSSPPPERLSGRRGTRRVLGVTVPVLSLAQTSHNLAALVEAACLDRRLRLDGIDAGAALERRQARAIKNRE